MKKNVASNTAIEKMVSMTAGGAQEPGYHFEVAGPSNRLGRFVLSFDSTWPLLVPDDADIILCRSLARPAKWQTRRKNKCAVLFSVRSFPSGMNQVRYLIGVFLL